MSQQQLWLLAGGDGVGKSTFYRTFLAPRGITFVNADQIACRVAPAAAEQASYAAAQIAARIGADLLRQAVSFCFETVFSHPSKIDFVATAKTHGYEIIMVFMYLQNAELNKARAARRVSEGGHNVPDDKIEARITRSLQHVRTVLPLCDAVHVLDNSSYDDPYQRIATVIRGRLTGSVDPLPDWAADLLEDYTWAVLCARNASKTWRPLRPTHLARLQHDDGRIFYGQMQQSPLFDAMQKASNETAFASQYQTMQDNCKDIKLSKSGAWK